MVAPSVAQVSVNMRALLLAPVIELTGDSTVPSGTSRVMITFVILPQVLELIERSSLCVPSPVMVYVVPLVTAPPAVTAVGVPSTS